MKVHHLIACAVVGLSAATAFATPAQAQSCPSDVTVMFYSHGEIELSQAGWDVVDAGLQRARASGCRARLIALDGAMDREWDSRTGVAVAEQRMTEMVNHLVRLGAPRQLIQNRVQFLDRVMTADGVREPMNRNITITIEYY